MLRTLSFVAGLIFLVGCEVERIGTTEFEEVPGGFTFEANAMPAYPLDTPEGEALRIQFLEKWLELNRTCPDGYRIASRIPTLVGEGMFGSMYRVRYIGVCV